MKLKLLLLLSCIAVLPAAAQIPTASLLAHYPFSGNANDASGNSNHATSVNSATLTTDRFGNPNAAYLFNGSTSYIALPAGSFTTLNVYSYSFWFKPTPGYNGMMICMGESSFGVCQAVVYQSTGVIFAGSYNSGSSPTQSYLQSVSVPTNVWHHVVMTRDMSTVKLYVNGSAVATSTTALTNNQNAAYGSNLPIRAYIGARTTSNNYFSGSIDDVRIYSTVLSANDVSQLFIENCFASNPPLSTTACNNNSISITAVPDGTNSLTWYSSLTSSVPVASGTLYASPVFSATGQYTVYAEAGNCPNPRTPVLINVLPQPAITVNSGTICTGNSFTISPSGASTYTVTGGSFVVSPVNTSTYMVTGTGSNGCVASNTAISVVNVNITPTIGINNGFVCQGSSFTLTPSGATNYTVIPGNAVVVTPFSNSSYTVAGSNGNGCTGYTVANVGVAPVPVVSVSGPSAICIGSSGSYTASGASGYLWSTGANTTVTALSPTSSAVYTVTGYNLFSCTDTETISISVSPLPTITATGGTLCAGGQFQIVPGGASTYSYAPSGPVVSPLVNTAYTVTGYNGQGCASQPVAVSLTVIPKPVITASSGTICAGSSFTIVPGGGVSYSVNGGSFIVSPASTTFYTVTGISAQGCTNAAVSMVTVSPLPSVVVTSPGTICAGSSATLAASGATGYLWSTGSLNSSVQVSPASTTAYTVTGTGISGCVKSVVSTLTVQANPTITASSGTICAGGLYQILVSGANSYLFSSGTAFVQPSTSQTYTVTGYSSAGCVSQPVISSVTALPLPSISVNSGSICAGQSFTIIPAGGVTYTIQGGSAIVSPSMNSTYVVIGMGSNGCATTATSAVSVNQLPALAIAGSSAVCINGTATYTASGATSYTWSTGAISATASVNPVSGTVYTIGVTGSSTAGCNSSATKSIQVNPLPAIAVNSGSICAGKVFVMSPTGAFSYTFSNGSSTVSPSSTSSYSVTGTSSQGCVSQAPAVSTVVVMSNPAISVNSGTICAGSSFTMSPSGGTSYTYSGGSAIVSPGTSTVYTVTGAGAQGCTATAQSTVSVNALPTISLTNPGPICSGYQATITASGGTAYAWNTGSTSASIVVSPTANTVYSVTGIAATGCSNTAARTVTVYAVPVVSVASGTVCSGRSFTLQPSGAASYTYSSGSNIVNPLVTTTYTIFGASAQGCPALNAAVATISVTASPTVVATGGTICAGSSFTISPSGASSYTYSSGSAVVSPVTNSSYTITGTGPGQCTGTAAVAVTVNALPVVTVTVPAVVCSGQSATLAAGGAQTYAWNTGAVTSTLSVVPASNTSYTVTGTNAAGCSANAIANVTVSSLPTVSATGGSICAGKTFTIVTAGASTYSVSGGSAVVSPANTTTYMVTGISSQGCPSQNTAVAVVSVQSLPAITVNSGSICSGSSFTMNPGGGTSYSYTGGAAIVSPLVNTSYTVTGTGTGGCTNTAVSTVSVVSTPTVVIAHNGPACSGAAITLTATGAASYTWSTGSISSTIALVSGQQQSVAVSGSSAGCAGSSALIFTVLPLPTVSVAGGTICAGDVFTLQPTGASSYSYSSGSATVSPSSDQSYAVTGISAQGCASQNTAVATVSVMSLPVLTVSGQSGVCAGNSVTLSVNGAANYTWTGIGTGSTAVITPASSSVIAVTGVDQNGCSGVATHSIQLNALPVVTVADGTVCPGGTFTLSPAGGVSYTYQPAGPVVSPFVTTSYAVTGEDANGCISLPVSATVSVINSITVQVSGVFSVCAGGSQTLTASGASSYSWSGGTTDATLAVTPANTNTYTLIGYSGQCSDTMDVVVQVHALPQITVPSGTICSGGSFTLAPSGAVTYTFENGMSVVNPTATTTYSMSGEDAQGCVSLPVAATVQVEQLPALAIQGPSVICAGETVTLSATGAANYMWSTNEQTAEIMVSPAATTGYSLTGVSQFSCSSTALFTVAVDACTGIAERRSNDLRIYPNPATDVLHVQFGGKPVSVQLVNALGEVVMQEENVTAAIFHTNRVAAGVYFCRIFEGKNIIATEKVIITR